MLKSKYNSDFHFKLKKLRNFSQVQIFTRNYHIYDSFTSVVKNNIAIHGNMISLYIFHNTYTIRETGNHSLISDFFY